MGKVICASCYKTINCPDDCGKHYTEISPNITICANCWYRSLNKRERVMKILDYLTDTIDRLYILLDAKAPNWRKGAPRP